jgi:cytoskeletal protein CcmA (bactofilin family)
MVDTLERRMAAWIGKAVRVEGKVISSQDLTVDGEVDGSVEVGDFSVTIGETAVVKADLHAKTITISGNVVGNVQAAEQVVLREGGSITGDVTAPIFSMTDGAIVIGKVNVGKPRQS